MKSSSETIEACPRCGSAEHVKPKLILVDRLDHARAGDRHRTWESTCAVSVAVTDLKPDLVLQASPGQFIQGLFCERCDLGYLPEAIVKPAQPQYPNGTSDVQNSLGKSVSSPVELHPVGGEIDEVEASRTGVDLLRRHGHGAYIVAATHAEAAAAAGDFKAALFWRQVSSGIKPR